MKLTIHEAGNRPHTLSSINCLSTTGSNYSLDKGYLTFDAEGSKDASSAFYSRTAHVPSKSSGVTIGRGYDMRHRGKTQIYSELIQSGFSPLEARSFSEAAGLHGKLAREFIKGRMLPEITESQEIRLFKLAYNQAENDVKRITAKSDVVAKYGRTDWNNLNPKIKEVLIDLRYRGDYNPETRRLIQESISRNDLDSFKAIMNDRNNWPFVPPDRFERRYNFLLQ